jgi:hypothetical protein
MKVFLKASFFSISLGMIGLIAFLSQKYAIAFLLFAMVAPAWCISVGEMILGKKEFKTWLVKVVKVKLPWPFKLLVTQID